MSSTWRSVVLAITAALLLAAVVLFILFRFVLPREAPEDPLFEPQFVIGSWEGQVAVFRGGDEYPMQVYDVYVRTLPPEEQKKVLEGIPVADAAGLSVLLEDYTS